MRRHRCAAPAALAGTGTAAPGAADAIPVFAIIAENMQQKTRVPGEIIAAHAPVANRRLTPRKKAVADLSALLRGPAQASTLLTAGTDA